ncbi:MAG: cell envelope biogenesis protein OmpA [Desulfatibacillum sp.]|nr:cell envelope biogenesis protein OmpA [Desulfatibacillum sp.]
MWLGPGCGPSRPVLYPNAHYTQVGKAQAQADIKDCIRMAKESGVTPGQGKKVAKNTAAGSAVGAVVGGAVGSMSGDFGRGAAIGAVGGGAGGFARGVFNSGEPNPVYKNFVDRCLREKGYEPMGWQ